MAIDARARRPWRGPRRTLPFIIGLALAILALGAGALAGVGSWHTPATRAASSIAAPHSVYLTEDSGKLADTSADTSAEAPADIDWAGLTPTPQLLPVSGPGTEVAALTSTDRSATGERAPPALHA